MNDQTKEEFCPACVAIPLAMAGVGISAAGADQSNGKHKKRKQIMLVVGLSSTLIFSAIAFYFLFLKKDCKSCKK